MMRCLTAAGLLLMLGCMPRIVEHEPEVSVAVPSAWQAPAVAGAVEPWLLAFDTPRLLELVREAWAANPDLHAAAARLARAEAEIRQLGAPRRPSVDYQLDASRTLLRDYEWQDDADLRYASTLSLRWDLDLWQRLADQQQAGVFRAEAAAADLTALRFSLAARVAQLWFQYAHARAQMDLAQRYHDNLVDTDSILRNRFRSGEVRAADIYSLQGEREQAVADLARWRRLAEAQLRVLEVVLGRYPAAALEIDPQLPEPPVLATAVPSAVMLRRPDLRSAAAQLLADNADLRAARKDLLPSFRVNLNAGASDDSLRQVLDPEHLVWSLVGSIFGPLYDGGRRRALVAIRQSTADAQLASYQDQVLQAFLEVEGALAASEHLRLELAAQTAAAEATQRSLAELRENYGLGVGDAIQVLQTARTAIRRHSQVLTLRQDRLLNHIDLALALGGPVLPSEEMLP